MSRRGIDIIRSLPEIFTLPQAAGALGMDHRAASVYVHRWRGDGLVDAAGERIAVFFNRLKIPEVTSDHRIAVAKYIYPSAMLAGESVLHAAGWITQIPASLTMDVLSRARYPSISGIDIRGRPKAWFLRMQSLGEPGEALHGLRALSPAAALADLYQAPGAWHPDPDDLDVPESDLPRLQEAFVAMGLDPSQRQDVFAGYRPSSLRRLVR